MDEYTHHFRSRHLGNERPVWVRPPRAGPAGDLFLFLDAEMYRERVGAVATIDELTRNGVIADAWFVFVSMHSVDARWIECPCHPPFARFIAEELMPQLGGWHPEIRSVDRRTVCGLSYTGLAAAYLAHEFPGMFAQVVSQSGSFWWNEAWLPKRFEVAPLDVPTAFYLEVGTRESQTDLQHRPDVFQRMSQVDGVRLFRDVLQAQRRSVEYRETDGAHDTESWKRALPDALRWALERNNRNGSLGVPS